MSWQHVPPWQSYGYPSYGPPYPPGPDADPITMFDRNISYLEKMKEQWKKEQDEKKKEEKKPEKWPLKGLTRSEVFWIMLVFSPIIGAIYKKLIFIDMLGIRF